MIKNTKAVLVLLNIRYVIIKTNSKNIAYFSYKFQEDTLNIERYGSTRNDNQKIFCIFFMSKQVIAISPMLIKTQIPKTQTL